MAKHAAELIVDKLLEGALDPGDFVTSFLASQFSDKRLLAVYAYINQHQFDSMACPICHGQGELNGRECQRCDGDGGVEDGSYREIVGLWNDAGKELQDLKNRLGGRMPDRRIRKLFGYMNRNIGTGVYREVVNLSNGAGRDIEAAVRMLKKQAQQ